MRLRYFFVNLIKIFLIFSLSFFTFNLNNLNANALKMNKVDEVIFEELRLNVPKQFRDSWIKAEKEIWEPWLAEQEGFLGRQIFYNVDTEEALLLVCWKSRYLWKNIKTEEVNKMQSIFEENIKKTLEIENNPFELIYEGELFEQKWS